MSLSFIFFVFFTLLLYRDGVWVGELMRNCRLDDEFHAQMKLLWGCIEPVLKKRRYMKGREDNDEGKKKGYWDVGLEGGQKRILMREMFGVEEEGRLSDKQRRLWRSTVAMAFPQLGKLRFFG